MQQFNISDVSATLIMTLTEKVTLGDPYFLFVFTHVTHKSKVVFLKATSQDESTNTDRYNQFTINPSVVFEDQPTGEYHYKVYEQASSTNTDEDFTGGVVEVGKLLLDKADLFEFEKYTTETTYTAYNG